MKITLSVKDATLIIKLLRYFKRFATQEIKEETENVINIIKAEVLKTVMKGGEK